MVAGARHRPRSRPAAERGTIAPVRKLIKIAVIAFGIRAFLRWRRSKREQSTREHEAAAPSASAPPPEADPADELRRRLAESRDDGTVEPPPAETSVADRRAEVHAEGRAALDEMKPTDEA
jgi:hypothetical protein